MGQTRRIEITVETEQVLVIRGRGGPVPAWCAGCGGESPLLPLDEAARLAGLSARAIYRRVEAGEVHFSETRDRLLLVCLKSLRL